MRRLLVWLVKWRDKHVAGTFRSLQSTGNWRVIYANGERTAWLDYTTASNLAAIYGGRLIHRADQQQEG